jgi:pimeloyl-ACP methyl ester carboxylesterase
MVAECSQRPPQKITPPVRDVDFNGYRMAYREWGTATQHPPLVLGHGITSSSLSWIRVAPRFASSTCVIALDLKGHGDSARPAEGARIADQAAEVTALCHALGLETIDLMGHSWGFWCRAIRSKRDQQSAAGGHRRPGSLPGTHVVEFLGLQTILDRAHAVYVIAAVRQWLRASFEVMYQDFQSCMVQPGRPLALRPLDQPGEAERMLRHLLEYAEQLEQTPVAIDYFATSLAPCCYSRMTSSSDRLLTRYYSKPTHTADWATTLEPGAW